VTPRAQLSDRSDTAALDERNRNAEALPFELQQKTITQKEFLSFQDLIYRTSGIWLSPGQTAYWWAALRNASGTYGLKVVRPIFSRGQRKSR